MAPTPTSTPTPVRARRHELGLTQDQLAERAGCDQTTVSAIELATVTPSLRLARAIAEALSTSVDELFPS